MTTATAIAPSSTAFVGLPKVLYQAGIFEEKKLLDLMATSASEKLPLVQLIARDHKAQTKKVAEALSSTLELPYIDIDGVDRDAFPPDALSDPKKIAELRAVPVFVRGPKMFVAASDPTSTKGLEFFTHKSGKRLEVLVVDDGQISALLASLGGDSKAVEAAGDASLDFGNDDPDSDDDGADGENSPVVKFVNGVLLTAIRKGASDIHFEPYEKFYRVRIRVDGAMREMTRPDGRWGLRIASRVKVISSLNIAEKRVPQDGRMKLSIPGGRAIDFRVSTLPTMYGEKIVMRILDPSAAQLGIDALGYEPEEKERLINAINRPYGMVLVTGPTGSGKTVSLYTCLNMLNREDINISTAEDPCEIQLAGINQVNVNPTAGLTFAAALKSFLRQDPDIIMVGEIRDEETAEISVKAAQTGHLVLATLHTNDAPKTIARLVEIGVKPYNVAGAVILITAQRLARKLCEKCKVEEDGLTPEFMKASGMTDDEAQGLYTRWKPFKANKEGCDSCNQGYKGRLGIYQVMPISEEIQSLVMKGADSMAISRQAQADGVRDLRQSALLKYRKGLTSMDEVIAVTNE